MINDHIKTVLLYYCITAQYPVLFNAPQTAVHLQLLLDTLYYHWKQVFFS